MLTREKNYENLYEVGNSNTTSSAGPISQKPSDCFPCRVSRKARPPTLGTVRAAVREKLKKQSGGSEAAFMFVTYWKHNGSHGWDCCPHTSTTLIFCRPFFNPLGTQPSEISFRRSVFWTPVSYSGKQVTWELGTQPTADVFLGTPLERSKSTASPRWLSQKNRFSCIVRLLFFACIRWTLRFFFSVCVCFLSLSFVVAGESRIVWWGWSRRTSRAWSAAWTSSAKINRWTIPSKTVRLPALVWSICGCVIQQF